MNPIYIAAITLGLASNFHCLGMCGPIALAIPLNRSSKVSMIMGILQYNLGRILIYSVLGAIVGLFGITIQTIGVLQWVSIIVGVILIIYAWRKYFNQLFPSVHFNLGIASFLSSRIGPIAKSQNPFKLFLLGGLNGLLPCGMVFTALINAVLGGSPINSAFAMALFGLGTLPVMILIPFVANSITSSLRVKLNKAVPYLLTVVGLLIVLRGMNLNIPYISPRVTITKNVNNSTNNNSVKMDCCHATSCD